MVDCVTIEERVAFGADGLLVSADSKTPWICIRSGTLTDITSSWTLVP